MQIPCEFHPYEGDDNPKVIESMHNATRQTITMTNAGIDVFEFKNVETGTHYVVNRATAARCMEFDRLVGFTSGRMGDRELQRRPWAQFGRA